MSVEADLLGAPTRDRTEDPRIKSPLLCQLSYRGSERESSIGHDALPGRFWSKVRVIGDCWVWLASLNSRGYALFSVEGRARLAHRVAYEALVGPIPDGLTIDHLCRIKRCVNPAHMEPVSVLENIQRAYLANRPSHCPRGHEYTPENTHVKLRRTGPMAGQINRTCRACERAARALRAEGVTA